MVMKGECVVTGGGGGGRSSCVEKISKEIFYLSVDLARDGCVVRCNIVCVQKTDKRIVSLSTELSIKVIQIQSPD